MRSGHKPQAPSSAKLLKGWIKKMRNPHPMIQCQLNPKCKTLKARLVCTHRADPSLRLYECYTQKEECRDGLVKVRMDEGRNC